MFLLDSALLSEAKIACGWGWVEGITTNPSLLAKSSLSPQETLRQLAGLTGGPVFYQLTAATVPEMIDEARRAADLLGDQLVLKILPNLPGFEVAARLSAEISCAITGVYDPAQALVAEASGARFVIIYYHRALTLLPGGEGQHLIKETASVLAESNTRLLAASIKSPQEAVSARRMGFEFLTLPFQVLQAMPFHDLSEKTAEEFRNNGTGL